MSQTLLRFGMFLIVMNSILFSQHDSAEKTPNSKNSNTTNSYIWKSQIGDINNPFFAWSSSKVSSLLTTDESIMIAINGSITSVSNSTGKEEWRFNTPGKWHQKPVFDRDICIFFTSQEKLFAIDRRSGRKIWERPFPLPERSAIALESSFPVIGEDRIYCGYALTPDAFRGTSGKTFCLNKKTGELIWENEAPYALNPFVSGTSLFTGFGKKYYAVDIDSRKIQWCTEINRMYFGKGIQHEGRLYIGGGAQSTHTSQNSPISITMNDGYLYCLDAKSGRKIWDFETGAYSDFLLCHSLILTRKHKFLNESRVFIDATSGVIKYEQNGGGTLASTSCSNAFAFIDGNIISWATPATQPVGENAKLDGTPLSFIEADDKVLYLLVGYSSVNSNQGYEKISMYKIDTNKLSTRKFITMEVLRRNAQIACNRDYIYFLSGEGDLYAFRLH